MKHVTYKEIDDAACNAAAFIKSKTDRPVLYPIPRGGVPAAFAINRYLPDSKITDDIRRANVIVDDLIDSGRTMKLHLEKNPNALPVTLFGKPEEYIAFPWEGESETASIEDNIIRILQFVGEDPNRPGLLETPKRFAKAWQEITCGYKQRPFDVLKVFEGEGYDEMIVVKDISFASTCEHHLLPFTGTATVAYIPQGKIVGLSKIPRLVDIFARRLQVQERLTCQIADALEEHLNPVGVGVLIKARHSCCEIRGINKSGHTMITSALRGALKDLPEARAEFMALLKD